MEMTTLLSRPHRRAAVGYFAVNFGLRLAIPVLVGTAAAINVVLSRTTRVLQPAAQRAVSDRSREPHPPISASHRTRLPLVASKAFSYKAGVSI
jgi:hypothetical protein